MKTNETNTITNLSKIGRIAAQNFAETYPKENVIGICILGSVARGDAVPSSDLHIEVYKTNITKKQIIKFDVDNFDTLKSGVVNILPKSYNEYLKNNKELDIDGMKRIQKIVDMIILYEKDEFLSLLREEMKMIKFPFDKIISWFEKIKSKKDLALSLYQGEDYDGVILVSRLLAEELVKILFTYDGGYKKPKFIIQDLEKSPHKKVLEYYKKIYSIDKSSFKSAIMDLSTANIIFSTIFSKIPNSINENLSPEVYIVLNQSAQILEEALGLYQTGLYSSCELVLRQNVIAAAIAYLTVNGIPFTSIEQIPNLLKSKPNDDIIKTIFVILRLRNKIDDAKENLLLIENLYEYIKNYLKID